MPPTPAVAVADLSKYFPQIDLAKLLTFRHRPGVWALRDVEFGLDPGESLGNNGLAVSFGLLVTDFRSDGG